MFIKTHGSAVYGVDALLITVEVNVSPGVNFFLVGLPDNAVKESHQRIQAALKNNGLSIPVKEITVNMAPADLRKEGASYDLTIAVGILAATEQLSNVEQTQEYLIMGELSLDGSVQSIRGVLPIAIQAKKEGFKGIILPKSNEMEAAVVEGIDVIGVSNIADVVQFFDKPDSIRPTIFKPEAEQEIGRDALDFMDVKGQEHVKRALEIAAAGGHNILLIGPPGVGKTMLAKRIPTILPKLSLEEALETTKIHSVCGLLGTNTGLVKHRPFRAPHHTVSDVALVGGGSIPKPGEISLAHHGILFLDELPEFKRSVLEVLRQPLEDRVVTISRARISVDYPSSFMLVASMNPSPSGDFFDPNDSSESEIVVKRYLNKVSGPLLDRIDLHIEVSPVPFEKLSDKRDGEPSAIIQKRVEAARRIQTERFKDHQKVHCNAELTSRLIRKYCEVGKSGETLLKVAMEKLGFSARSYARIFKVARTIADLSQSEHILDAHIAEAIQYRSLDRDGWS